MTFQKVFDSMSNNGYKLSMIMMTSDGISYFMPQFKNIKQSSMVPAWIKSQDEKEVICILGSEPSDESKPISISMQYIEYIVSAT